MKAIEGERSSPIDRSQISSPASKKARSQSDIMQCAAADTYVGAHTHTHPSFVPNGEDERDGTDGGAALIPAAALWSTDLALCWLCSACQCEREREREREAMLHARWINHGAMHAAADAAARPVPTRAEAKAPGRRSIIASGPRPRPPARRIDSCVCRFDRGRRIAGRFRVPRRTYVTGHELFSIHG